MSRDACFKGVACSLAMSSDFGRYEIYLILCLATSFDIQQRRATSPEKGVAGISSRREYTVLPINYTVELS